MKHSIQDIIKVVRVINQKADQIEEALKTNPKVGPGIEHQVDDMFALIQQLANEKKYDK